ncbi:MAG: hypothetical protein J2O38_06005, partial [Acidimicrobiales bacterium]|nr:hypothetical protein [Acidimicrobiales bacterium]
MAGSWVVAGAVGGGSLIGGASVDEGQGWLGGAVEVVVEELVCAGRDVVVVGEPGCGVAGLWRSRTVVGVLEAL